MKRTDLRQLKRSARKQHDLEALEALLDRSVHFGHKRLALLRCLLLERMGGQVKLKSLHYCERIAADMPREALEKIFRQVANTSIRGFHDKEVESYVPTIFP